MRRVWWFALAGLMAVGCVGGSSHESPLVGEWLVTDASGTNGAGLTFNSDGTYVAQILELTSSTSANDEGEYGVYTATSNTIALTPQKSSCPGPDPAYSMTYSFSGPSLVVGTPSGAVLLERNPYANSGATGTITWGCFQPDGSFIASPLVPVGN